MKLHMLNLLVLLIFIFNPGILPKLNAALQTDSLSQMISRSTSDTAKILLLVKAGRACLYSDPQKTKTYIDSALNLSARTDFPYGRASSLLLAAAYENDIQGNLTKARQYLGKADSMFRKEHSLRSMEGNGAVLHTLAVTYQKEGNYLEAVEYYQKASRILDSIGNKSILMKTYNNLSSLYAFFNRFSEAERYARLCIKLAEDQKDKHLVSVGSITLAAALIQEHKGSEVKALIQRALDIAARRNDLYIQLLCDFNLSEYYRRLEANPALSLQLAKKALRFAKNLGNPFEISRTSLSYSETLFEVGKYDSARMYAEKAMAYATKAGYMDLEQRALEMMGRSDIRLGNAALAAPMLEKSLMLRDSVFTQENQQQINFLETLFQKEQREQQIARLEQDKSIKALVIRRNHAIIYSLVITLFLVLGIVAYLIQHANQKRRFAEHELQLKEQQLIALEKTQQLIATQSVLEGEEAERSRLARDLHDGLGGLLSGIKLKLANMKGNAIISREGMDQYDHALELLDTSIRELRQVAHNLMPESLIKFGLKVTLSDFCDTLTTPSRQVKFAFFGTEKRLEDKLEIGIYRIVQELVNNSLRHAGASETFVQLVQDENRLHLMVQDNGKGFDPGSLNLSKGKGLANIRSRVNSFGGTFDISSSEGSGTEISAEFSL